MRLARLEDLMDRRPLLLNSVLLRQNPHNVHEWHKRVKLYEGRPREVRGVYGACAVKSLSVISHPIAYMYYKIKSYDNQSSDK